MDMIFMNLKKKLTLGVILTLPWSFIHVYEHYNQRNLLVYISDLRSAFTGPFVHLKILSR